MGSAWSQPPAPTVAIWQIDTKTLDAHTLAGLPDYLTPAEQARWFTIQHPKAQRNFLVGRAALRVLLSRATGQTVTDLELGMGRHGKPFLVNDPTLHFNLSHGGDWLAIALSWHQPVGIDLEPIRPRPRLPGLCRRCLTDRETQTVLSLPSQLASQQFLRYWTCKEAYVKGLGVGLTIPLTVVDLTLPERTIPAIPTPLLQTQGLAQGWAIYQWQPTPGYVAALAIAQKPDLTAPAITLQTLSF